MKVRFDIARLQTVVSRVAAGIGILCALFVSVAVLCPSQLQIGPLAISVRTVRNPFWLGCCAWFISRLTSVEARARTLRFGRALWAALSATPRVAWDTAKVVGTAINRPRILLALILSLHFVLRMVSHGQFPGERRHNFERVYGHSLSVMAGRGLADIALTDDATAVPFKDFLDGKRTSIDSAAWQDYWGNPPSPDRDDQHNLYGPLATTRVLDLYLAAGLWSLFGIHWTVLYVFYAVVSTLVCGAIYLLASRLTNHAWAGLCAAALFSVSPLERFLSAWSIRDVSPMWFAAACFVWLLCVCQRCERPKWTLVAYAGLGALSLLGLGWRSDVLILPPFLLLMLIVVLREQSRPWRIVAGASCAFLVGAAVTFSGIRAVTPPNAMPAQTGFHMAFYSDLTRSRMLHLENTFQVHGSDMQNLFVARHYDRTHQPDAEFLPYLSARYASVCRAMFFDELRYNAFRWISNAPWLYFHTLGAYPSSDGPAWNDYGNVGACLVLLGNAKMDPLTRNLRYPFVIGLVAIAICAPRKAAAAMLALFTVYNAAILFLVLPSQKHLGPLLVPLHVFAGIGIWGLSQAIRSDIGARLSAVWNQRAVWLGAKVLAGATACWAVTCGIAYFESCHERGALLAAIREHTRDAEDARELIKGNRTFTVALPPDEAHDLQGYLLRIKTGKQPSTLLCQHARQPHDWCWLWWPYLFSTSHPLYPDREQYFFVTCIQGVAYGDPRPYICVVSLEGDAEIVDAQRIDLKDWNRLPIATVFYDGERQPGSPHNSGRGSQFQYLNLNAFRMPLVDPPALLRREKEINNVKIPPFEPTEHPVHHVLARDSATGLWKIADSDGWQFHPRVLNHFAPSKTYSCAVLGDFQGTGFVGLLTYAPDTTRWYLVKNRGAQIDYVDTPDWTGGVALEHIIVGDFNGDGLDDVAGYEPNSQEWRMGISNGEKFIAATWGRFSPDDCRHVVAGDFNGDGKTDVAAYDQATGDWMIGLSDGKQFTMRRAAGWDNEVDWQHIICRDLNGDGRDDLAAWDPDSGRWWLAYSEGSVLRSEKGPIWPRDVDWRDVQTADLDAKGQLALIARDASANRFIVSPLSSSNKDSAAICELPNAAEQLFVGDFDGDGRDDVAWRRAGTSDLWVGMRHEAVFDFHRWGKLETEGELVDAHVVQFWPQTKRKPLDSGVEHVAAVNSKSQN